MLKAPKSKSSMQRACAAASYTMGITEIAEPGFSNDDMAALDTISKLGAEVLKENDRIIVKSSGVHPHSAEINCGESGLGIRMFTPIAALSKEQLTISGTGSLVTRPMDFFDAIFPQLGIQITSNQGKLPLVIKGPLTPQDITVDGSLSSQFLTGLLMAFSAANASGVTITVNRLTSKPYIDLTLDVMTKFGMKVPEVSNYEKFFFSKEDSKIASEKIRYTVEGDWSGGAFLLVAGAFAGGLDIEGLQPASPQADKAILDALKLSGANVQQNESLISIRPAELVAFNFDATECPDLFPPLVALAAASKRQYGIERSKKTFFQRKRPFICVERRIRKIRCTCRGRWRYNDN